MGKSKLAGSVLLGMALVALPGCIPITIPLDIPVGAGVTLDLDGFVPGMPIPAEYASIDYQLCADWPDINRLKQELRKAVGGLADIVKITAVSPEEVVFTASQGNFLSLDDLGLSIVFPDDSSVDVVADISADGAQVTISPSEPINLIGLLGQYGGNNTCVDLTVTATGVVPDPLPVVDIRVKGTITVEL